MSHAQQHTDSTKLTVPGWDWTYNALVSILLSQHSNPLCQPGIVVGCNNNIWNKWNNTNITDNNTNITDNNTNITDNSTNITDNSTNITDNSTNITDNSTNITDNSTNITDNSTNITDNSTNITDNNTNITDNNTNITDKCSLSLLIEVKRWRMLYTSLQYWIQLISQLIADTITDIR